MWYPQYKAQGVNPSGEPSEQNTRVFACTELASSAAAVTAIIFVFILHPPNWPMAWVIVLVVLLIIQLTSRILIKLNWLF